MKSHNTKLLPLLLLAISTFLGIALSPAPASAADPERWDFSYTGAYQTFTAPAPGLYQIEAWGASGATYVRPGRGAYTKGKITLDAGETLYIYVGSMPTNNIGGYNGGGNGGHANAFGGGGATDVRYRASGLSGADLNWNSAIGLNSRIMVAAGGGSQGNSRDITYGGGAGGTISGQNGIHNPAATTEPNAPGKGGTQTSGGAGGVWGGGNGATASFGAGGNGASSTIANRGGAGGGGGYYGGGGGSRCTGVCSFPAGGGSSFISGHPGSRAITSESSRTPIARPEHYSGMKFTDTQMVAGNAYMPRPAGGTELGHPGDGFVRIESLNEDFIKMNGEELITLNLGDTYTEEGAYAVYDAGLIPFDRITLAGSVDTSVPGSYFITYSYRELKITRKVNVLASYAFSPVCSGYQTFVAPTAGTYEMRAWGASGSGSNVGLGGYTKGQINAATGDTFYIYIGCRGVQGSGGYNGGGQPWHISGWGGGGATDVRYRAAGLSGTNLDWNSTIGLNSRIMVAAGGGAQGPNRSASGYRGGHAGGVSGQTGISASSEGAAPGRGASQTAGGAGGTWQGNGSGLVGTFGIGGTGATPTSLANGSTNRGGSGGGGGYYGGGGGASCQGICGFPGGGGSSFISGHTGSVAITSESSRTPRKATNGTTTCANGSTDNTCSKHYSGMFFTSTQTIAGAVSMPGKNGATAAVGNTGDGYFEVELVGLPKSPDASLSSLSLEGYTLNETFLPTQTAYTLTIADPAVTSGKILADTTSPMASVVGTGAVDIHGGANVYTITVTAEAGNIQIYTLTVDRLASALAQPLDISISGLNPSWCAIDEAYCILTIDDVPVVFDPATNLYSMVVPNRTTSVTFTVDPAHPFQTITGAGVFPLSVGSNVNIITVTAENGLDSSQYLFTIVRDLALNTNLASLDITNTMTPFTAFDPATTEYFVDVAANTFSLDLTALPEDPSATVDIYGNSNFVTGLQDVVIKVTSQKGTAKEYIIHVSKEADGNALLSSLSVKNSVDGVTVYPLSPTFNKSIKSYIVNVPGDVSEIELLAATDSPGASVSGLGVKSLVSGNNQSLVTVTAENGTIVIYDVNIIKARSSNADLAVLFAPEGELSPAFDPGITDYTLDIDAGFTSLALTATPAVPTAQRIITGNKNFAMGDRNTVTITVFAEDGSYKVYTIRVNRMLPEDDFLSDITLSSGTLSPAFDPETLSYAVAVPNETISFTVTGVKSDPLAYISGNGIYYLAPGPNPIDLVVTSQAGTTRTYSLLVTRAASTNTNLLDLENDAGATLSPAFSNSIDDYVLNVSHPTEEISFVALREDLNSTVSGDLSGNILQTGPNTLSITITAEDGVTARTINLTVVRDRSQNANLSWLLAEAATLSPTFDPFVILYDLSVPYEYESLTLDLETEYPAATYEISGNSNFVVGSINTVTIKVISETGEPYVKNYILRVTRQSPETSSTRLASLSTDQGTLSPAFDPATHIYNIVLPYESTEISVSAAPEDPAAGVAGTGSHSLSVGRNLLPITVTAQGGATRVYHVIVTRQSQSDARLSSLDVTGAALDAPFSPDTFAYTITTDDYSLDLSPVPIDPLSSYEILGNSDFVLGSSTVTIRVTAADGVTVLDYTLTVTRTANNNNNLASLSAAPGTLTPLFNKAITLYTVTVGNDVGSVLVSATAEDRSATIAGLGSHSLSVGLNTITVTITSESGHAKTYLLLVTKARSDNNYLSSLIASEGTLSPAFDKTTNNYSLTVPYSAATIDLNGTLDAPSSVATGLGSRPLSVGDNTLSITVISESGLANTYTLTVTREQINSADIIALATSSTAFSFNQNVTGYVLDVGNEITSLADLSITLEDPVATYAISGNADFIVGMNIVSITVTARDGVTTKTYTLHVNRQMSANNFLDWFSASDGTISPAFDKLTMDYVITVTNDIATITFDGEPESATSTVSGLGAHIVLFPGDNFTFVTVTSATGIARTYRINVIRAMSSVSTLSDLYVQDGDTALLLSPLFDPATTTYSVAARPGLSEVDLVAYPTDAWASVSGTGVHPVVVGPNSYTITVTAEDGSTNIYTIHLSRPASTSADLSALSPSIGTLQPAFDPAVTAYQIDLSDALSLISFAATPADALASISNPSPIILGDGANIINILVTAEDGITTKTYTITVNQFRTNEARLASLSLLDADGVTAYPLDPAFDPDTYTYSVTLPSTKTSLSPSEVLALPIDSGTLITKSPALDLSADLGTTLSKPFTITTLAADTFTTQEYTISISRLPAYSTTITSTPYTINREVSGSEYIIGILPSTTLSDFLSGIDNPPSHLQILSPDGITPITDPTTPIGTNMTLKLTIDSTTYDTLTVIVRGDVTGEGLVDITDISRIRFYVVNKITFTDIELLAADVTGENLTDITDISRIRFFVVNKLTAPGLNPPLLSP